MREDRRRAARACRTGMADCLGACPVLAPASAGHHNAGTCLILQQRSMKYAIVIEKSPSNFSAYVPDLPGCVATGATRKGVTRLIREAIDFHIEGLRQHGEPVPVPGSAATVEPSRAEI